eukprot:9964737-Lingulodinium_polyedra.AAC.1
MCIRDRRRPVHASANPSAHESGEMCAHPYAHMGAHGPLHAHIRGSVHGPIRSHICAPLVRTCTQAHDHAHSATQWASMPSSDPAQTGERNANSQSWQFAQSQWWVCCSNRQTKARVIHHPALMASRWVRPRTTWYLRLQARDSSPDMHYQTL